MHERFHGGIEARLRRTVLARRTVHARRARRIDIPELHKKAQRKGSLEEKRPHFVFHLRYGCAMSCTVPSPTKSTSRTDSHWKPPDWFLRTAMERQCLKATKVVETQGKQGKGSVLATEVVEAQGKGSVLATEVVEAQGKGGVSATKGVDAQDKGTAPSGRHNGRKRQRQWQHKATSVPFGAVHRQGCTVHRAFPAAGQSQPPSPRPESTPDTSRAGELRSRKAVGRRYGKALHWTADRQIGSARRHGGSGKHKAKALAKPSGSTPARPRPTTRRPTRTARGSAPAGHPAIATAVRGERRRETMQGGGRNRVRQRTKGREQQRAPQHYGEVEGQRK